MAKHIHEFRDPVHVFVRLKTDERRVVDSRPFQRLRDIHQLAMTYLVYPGATHRRFEHSLGVMELASRVFDIVTDQRNIGQAGEVFPEVTDERSRLNWKAVLRMAALLHDIGHLPFSHAAEKELLPEGWSHETLTRKLILSEDVHNLLSGMNLQAETVAKIALGPKEAPDLEFTPWETILSEILVGDAFGVDRMDYLLRDSLHTGVAYGRFDHYRLIDTLRILPQPPPAPCEEGDGSGASPESCEAGSAFALGVEEGGLQSSEALMFARYFMFSQMYIHPIRRIYDEHLKDFLKDWLPGGAYPIGANEHLSMTDAEVLSALHQSANNSDMPGHAHAKRIVGREHFKVVYEKNPVDSEKNPEAGKAIAKAAAQVFGADKIRHNSYSQEGGDSAFPVKRRDDQVASSLSLSSVLLNMPVVSVDYIFAARDIETRVLEWIRQNKNDLITQSEEEDGETT
ncbi:metal dependent phosphohydrolase [Desulfatibacillum aliphaticivorans]|uniref:Metal dependent phosphohydrolase n=1 Tax=Desulfatibacillum aliphaticivorans TaxID=218208 RepID=B8FCJ1_DESAL|nr:HD domain-containing protein [Desulfatibacillum aliphaticivorans]ACL06154.1 metal dependent phosphohydrolase [Desulfatibacillum aliphaticivorans]